jgi:hypothetical protein
MSVLRVNRTSNTSCPFLRSLIALAVAATANAAIAQSTVEEKNSKAVYQVKAPAVHALGITGAGVTAAILDSGVLTSHKEFGGRLLTGYNAFDGSTNVNDAHGHGTHVTGLVGAGKDNPGTSGMLGVAYEANLLPIKVLGDSGSGTGTSIARGISYAVSQRNSSTLPAAHKPFVMNLSLGVYTLLTAVETPLKNAVSSGMVVVAAAGNSGKAAPAWPARYAKETWANGQIVAVGAVDANNIITSWSDRAGDAKDFYLVAPGVNVYSTYKNGGYVGMNGTSMAAPTVTGAVALVKSGWPYLTAPQVTSILFASATDLGAAGVDAVYGRGLLNLERALEPIGQIAAPTTEGTTVVIDDSATVKTSPAKGKSVKKAASSGKLKFAAFDSYGRDFQVDLASNVRSSTSPHSLTGMLSAFDSALEQRYLRDGSQLRIAYRSEMTRLSLGEESGFGAGKQGFAVSSFDSAGRELLFGLSGMGTNAFGLAGELANRDVLSAPQLGNPYFALAQQYTHAGVGLPLHGGLRVKVGMLVSDPRVSVDGVPQISERRQSMTLGEVSKQFASGLWTVGVGRLQENDSVLGTTQTGALGFAGGTGTTVANLGVAFFPSDRVQLGAQISVGYTDSVANNSASLVTGYSGSRSDAFSLFASLKEPFSRGDRLSLTVAQPMRTASGDMNMVLPVRADANGAPVLESRSLSLQPDGREIRADLLYMSRINRHANSFVGVTLRHQPDHDAAASAQATLGVGIRAVF